MICRLWRSLAKTEKAQEYELHLRTEIFPTLKMIPGFLDASILARTLPNGTEFVVVTHWESIESIREFAGPRVDMAVVPPKVQELMIECDPIVRHYDVLE